MFGDPLACSICKARFDSCEDLTRHRNTHRKQQLVQCDLCGKLFRGRRSMRKHMETHEENRSVTCEMCGKVLASKEALKTHDMRVHITEMERENKRRPCEICGKMILENNKSHVLTHSEERKTFKCAKCDKIFYVKERLELHLEADESNSVFDCLICDKSFPTEKYLKRHHEVHHTQEKRYFCDQCSQRFSSKHEFYRHVQTHSNERPFHCDECGKTFKPNNHLKKHIQCHRDEELGTEAFKCQYCGKCSRNSWSLYRHTSKFHRTDSVVTKRIHQCTICGRRLFDAKNLGKHYAAVHKCVLKEGHFLPISEFSSTPPNNLPTAV